MSLLQFFAILRARWAAAALRVADGKARRRSGNLIHRLLKKVISLTEKDLL